MDFSIIYKLRTKQYWWLDVLLYFAISLLIAIVFCYFIFSVKASIVKKDIEAKATDLHTVGTDDQKAQEKEVLGYIKKINDFNTLFKNHKFASNAFAFMQKETMPYIWFKRFSLDQKGASIQLTGQADNMDNFSRQIAVFETNSYIKKLGSISSTIQSDGSVDFGTNLSLDQKVFNYALDLALQLSKETTITPEQPSQTDITGPGKSKEKMITVFDLYIGKQEVIGQIDQNNHSITVNVPYGTDITQLVSSVVTSPKASVFPVSGFVGDFTKPVAFKVTAEDLSVQNYQVTVNILPKEESKTAGKSGIIAILIFVIVVVIAILTIVGAIIYRNRKNSQKPKEPYAN